MITADTVVAIASVAIALIALIISTKHNSSVDVEKEIEEAKQKAARDTRLETTLGMIQSDTGSIKTDMKGMKQDVQEVATRLTKVEESTKSAHHRIDRLEGEKNEN